MASARAADSVLFPLPPTNTLPTPIPVSYPGRQGAAELPYRSMNVSRYRARDA